ncbi:hypothetical protein R6Q59_027551 [Mikania micrantha]
MTQTLESKRTKQPTTSTSQTRTRQIINGKHYKETLDDDRDNRTRLELKLKNSVFSNSLRLTSPLYATRSIYQISPSVPSLIQSNPQVETKVQNQYSNHHTNKTK